MTRRLAVALPALAPLTRTGGDIAFHAAIPVSGSSGLGATSCTNAPFLALDAGALVRRTRASSS